MSHCLTVMASRLFFGETVIGESPIVYEGPLIVSILVFVSPTCLVGPSDCGIIPCLRLFWYPLCRGKVTQ
jgi:hypothetical protein